MSKRPWDRCNKGRGKTLPMKVAFQGNTPHDSAANSLATTTSSSTKSASCIATDAVPYITVNNTKYYSDRFYLHRTVFDDDNGPFPLPPGFPPSHSCSCKVPPLLDRAELINSLDIKAAIMATYTLNLQWMAESFPQLCGPDATIPTLILHGQKGLKQAIHRKKKKKKEIMMVMAATHSDNDNDNNHDNDESSSDDDDDDNEEWNHSQAPEEESSNHSIHHIMIPDTPLPPHLQLTQVYPRWLPRSKQQQQQQQQEFNTVNNNNNNSAKPISRDEQIQKTEYRQGVHHPKYMILFCHDGSCIVVVSTGNLTSPTATDASWIQKFDSVSTFKTTTTSSSSSSSSFCDDQQKQQQKQRYVQTKVPKAQQRRTGSDFGIVLTDFLSCQSHATERRGMTPQMFLQTYMNYNNSPLKDFQESFQFHKAQVHLIATVPGDYEGRSVKEHIHKDGDFVDVLYGRQRVADILARLAAPACDRKRDWTDPAWMPDALLSKYDRLLFQPTSIGAHWTLRNLSHVVRSYLGHDDKSKGPGSSSNKDGKLKSKTNLRNNSSSCKKLKATKNRYSDAKYCEDDQKILERLDIVWPSMKLMNSIDEGIKSRRRQMGNAMTQSPRSVVEGMEENAIQASTDKMTASTDISAEMTGVQQELVSSSKAVSISAEIIEAVTNSTSVKVDAKEEANDDTAVVAIQESHADSAITNNAIRQHSTKTSQNLSSICFMSSKSFNSIQPSCLSQLVM